uniref:Cytochrome c biogenesis protein CcsB n=1 Tax=Riquetophycus sp. TaxID=1897556 RepID=A0A1C9C882_9FLOR|nr:c-type cytochrome biogenensis protein [Riquetophycus sp.]
MKRNIIWYIVKKLSNLNASITMLLIIAVSSILGTLIEQDKSLDYYKLNYPMQNNHFILINWQIIKYLGLDHVYINWWFLSLLSLFFCTLISCTFSRQLPSLRNARNWKFAPYRQMNQYHQTLSLSSIYRLPSMIHELNRRNYYVFNKGSYIYGYKGLIGRIAPIWVHISIIMTLIGSLMGLFSGFMSQQMIAEGEIFHVQNIIKSGLISSVPNNIIGKINNFNIDYNTDKSINQFYSSITLLSNNKKYLNHKIISVNSPLRFSGLTFYQTDWKISALRIEIDHQYNVQNLLKETKIGNTKIWIYQLPINSKKDIYIVVTGLKDIILLFDEIGQQIYSVKINEKFQINNLNIVIKEIMPQTGIQIKSDPGIIYVYMGFFILIISIILSYLSYSQIWIYNKQQKLYIRGMTNRGKLTFEEEFIDIQKSLIKWI